VVSVLASGTRVRGFKPGRKPSFGGEVKPSVPCRSFAACKKIPYDFRGSRDLKANRELSRRLTWSASGDD
jgi:hypothetical protein